MMWSSLTIDIRDNIHYRIKSHGCINIHITITKDTIMDVVKCRCGCGKELTTNDKYGRVREYISGHNNRKYDDPNEYRKRWVRDNRKIVNKARRKRLKKRKIELMSLYTDNKCVSCGVEYNGKNGVIFQFHHIIPENKKFVIGSNLEKPFDILCEEVQKCDLYCANCHFILHIGEY